MQRALQRHRQQAHRWHPEIKQPWAVCVQQVCIIHIGEIVSLLKKSLQILLWIGGFAWRIPLLEAQWLLGFPKQSLNPLAGAKVSSSDPMDDVSCGHVRKAFKPAGRNPAMGCQWVDLREHVEVPCDWWYIPTFSSIFLQNKLLNVGKVISTV